MRGIVGTSLRFGLLMIAVAVGIVVLGITQLREMPVDVLPEFAPTYVEVQTEALGLSAQEVEQLITVPLEVPRLERHAYEMNALYRRTPPAFKCVDLGPIGDLVPGASAGLVCP